MVCSLRSRNLIRLQLNPGVEAVEKGLSRRDLRRRGVSRPAWRVVIMRRARFRERSRCCLAVTRPARLLCYAAYP